MARKTTVRELESRLEWQADEVKGLRREKEGLRSRLEMLERDGTNLEDQLTGRRGQLDDALEDTPTREELEEFARDFDEIWTVAGPEDRNKIVHAVIERITVYATGRIKVIFSF